MTMTITLVALATLIASDAPAEPSPPSPRSSVVASAGAPVTVVVSDLRADNVQRALSGALTDLVAFELRRYVELDVRSMADARALLDIAATQQVAGCMDEACLPDVAKLLSAQVLVAGAVRRTELGVAVDLVAFDANTTTVIARSHRAVTGSEDDVVPALRVAVTELMVPLVGARPADEATLLDVLERARTAERPKRFDAGASLGVNVPFAFDGEPVLAAPGASITLAATWQLSPMFGVGARIAGEGCFSTTPGTLIHGEGTSVVKAVTHADARFASLAGLVALRMRADKGLTLPWLEVGVGAGAADLQLGDVLSDDTTTPAFLLRQRVGGSGVSLDAIARAGVTLFVADAVSIDVGGGFHVVGTSIVTEEFVGGVDPSPNTSLGTAPFAPLFFGNITLGVSWQS